MATVMAAVMATVMALSVHCTRGTHASRTGSATCALVEMVRQTEARRLSPRPPTRPAAQAERPDGPSHARAPGAGGAGRGAGGGAGKRGPPKWRPPISCEPCPAEPSRAAARRADRAGGQPCGQDRQGPAPPRPSSQPAKWKCLTSLQLLLLFLLLGRGQGSHGAASRPLSLAAGAGAGGWPGRRCWTGRAAARHGGASLVQPGAAALPGKQGRMCGRRGKSGVSPSARHEMYAPLAACRR